jgi:hypothetical protein
MIADNAGSFANHWRNARMAAEIVVRPSVGRRLAVEVEDGFGQSHDRLVGVVNGGGARRDCTYHGSSVSGNCIPAAAELTYNWRSAWG